MELAHRLPGAERQLHHHFLNNSYSRVFTSLGPLRTALEPLHIQGYNRPMPLIGTRTFGAASLVLTGAASVCLLGFGLTALGQVATNPIALWAFDEGAGTTAFDSSGNNHSASIIGAAYATGWSNTCLSINGSNSYAFIPDSSAGGTTGAGLDIGTRDWTIAAWINTTNSGMVVTKMGFVGGANPDGWGLSISGNGTVGGSAPRRRWAGSIRRAHQHGLCQRWVCLRCRKVARRLCRLCSSRCLRPTPGGLRRGCCRWRLDAWPSCPARLPMRLCRFWDRVECKRRGRGFRPRDADLRWH